VCFLSIRESEKERERVVGLFRISWQDLMGAARAQLDERVAAGRALRALLQLVLVVELHADRLTHRAGRNVKLFHHSGCNKIQFQGHTI
jgi:hypothetical protein